MTTLFTILFDGVAYGMQLFVLACGLAVTLGLMNFVNLAHGAFAMTGGYVCAVLVNQSGWPFFAALPLAFVASAAIGVVLERSLYRHLYTRSHLDQVLFSVGLVFMSVAAVDYIMGSSRIFIKLPAALEGQIDFFGVGVGRYRLMIIVICGLLTAGLQLVLARTRFGSRLRAAVDDPRAASGLGINVPQVFAFTFAFGCGLAGLGGALSAEILGLDPYFPLKFMIYFLIVVTVGGSSRITGPFLASLLLGIGDVAGKYYVPKMGPFVIYTIMIVILIWRPNPVRPHGCAMIRHDLAQATLDIMPGSALALGRDAVLDAGADRDPAVSEPLSDHDRDRLACTVRALARPDPRLCRHHLARPRRAVRYRRRRPIPPGCWRCTASS
jgi:branched-chain amino acid transport system permease protein